MTLTRVCGWGRSRPALSDLSVLDPDFVPAAIMSAGSRGIVGLGAGRSYGDAAQNSGGQLAQLPSGIALGHRTGIVRAAAGTSFEQLLQASLPHGWTLPVLPGTRHLTVGGAVAADVHGKNHPRDGSLGRWLSELVVVDGTGSRLVLTPHDDRFWATVGGMGLTGLILSATIQLLPVTSSWLHVRDTTAASLDELIMQLDEAAAAERWAVAWVDGMARGASLGRGIVSRARELPSELAPGNEPLSYPPASATTAPKVPLSVIRPLTVRAFNAAWWRQPTARDWTPVSLTSFFHPLDSIRDWNRLYGPRGFLQYQFVVPVGQEPVLRRALVEVTASGGAPFLGVLKRFGEAGRAPLSFPRPGWSLAVDLPQTRGLAGVLDRLDEHVAAAGGAVYLAKDARLRPHLLAAMYPKLGAWRTVQARMDPQGRMQSDLDRRLGVVVRA